MNTSDTWDWMVATTISTIMAAFVVFVAVQVGVYLPELTWAHWILKIIAVGFVGLPYLLFILDKRSEANNAKIRELTLMQYRQREGIK